jgi:general secretion pathway protein G
MPKHRRRARRRARGVTLVEVLIVVAIMSLLAAGVAIYAVPRYAKARQDTAVVDARALLQVAETWKLNHVGAGECTSVEKLKDDKFLPPDRAVKDPWGQPYLVVCIGDDLGVTSAGADGARGTEDDVGVGAACARARSEGHPLPIGCTGA